MTDPLNLAEAQVVADRQLAAQHPNDISHQRRFVVSMHRLVAQYRQAGAPERSAGLGDEAIGIIARITAADPRYTGLSSPAYVSLFPAQRRLHPRSTLLRPQKRQPGSGA